MSHKRSNQWLKYYRENFPDVELLDLTIDCRFDWRHFVASVPDAETIVGPGVVGFGFLRMAEVW